MGDTMFVLIDNVIISPQVMQRLGIIWTTISILEGQVSDYYQSFTYRKKL